MDDDEALVFKVTKDANGNSSSEIETVNNFSLRNIVKVFLQFKN